MKFLQSTLASFVLLSFTASSADASIVSTSTSRLPMSISSVITDLEAEGVHHISTATILTSKSVTSTDRTNLFKLLFPEDDTADEDEEEEDFGNEPTVIGKKFGSDDEDGIGIIVANPSSSAAKSSAQDIASCAAMTVLATHGTVIFVVDSTDLKRGEGLFRELAPAIESLLKQKYEEFKTSNEDKDEGEEESEKSSELIVIFQDATSQAKLEQAKSQFQQIASKMLTTIVRPSTTSSDVQSLEQVFDTVEYMSTDSMESVLTNTLVEGKGQLLEPWDAASSVAQAVGTTNPLSSLSILSSNYNLQSPTDIATARILGSASRKAYRDAIERLEDITGGNPMTYSKKGDDGENEMVLVPDFGSLCDAILSKALQDFESSVAGNRALRSSPVFRRKRSDFMESLLEEVGEFYDAQLDLLNKASFESFQKGLSTLRLSPNLPQDMEQVVTDTVKQFAKKSKGLRPIKFKAATSKSSSGGGSSLSTGGDEWSSPITAKNNLKNQLNEYCAERLKVARMSGQYKPLPRKGVTVGLHWLLPKPFGNDYRQNPTDIYRGNLIYSPSNSAQGNVISEVNPEEVKKGTGDWRRSIVPVPSGTEMMFNR